MPPVGPVWPPVTVVFPPVGPVLPPVGPVWPPVTTVDPPVSPIGPVSPPVTVVLPPVSVGMLAMVVPPTWGVPPVLGGILAVVVPPTWGFPPVAVVVPPFTCPAAPVTPAAPVVPPLVCVPPPVAESQPCRSGMVPARSKATEPRTRACVAFLVLVRIAASIVSSLLRILADALPLGWFRSAIWRNNGSNNSHRLHGVQPRNSLDICQLGWPDAPRTIGASRELCAPWPAWTLVGLPSESDPARSSLRRP